MRKPTNNWAVALWVLAGIVAVGQLLEVATFTKPDHFANGGGYVWVAWSYVRTISLAVGQLAAFGVIIELIDQIRWNALPPDQRKGR